MPRGPEPSWEMKRAIIDLAAKQGQDNLSAIQRDLDKLWKEEPLKGDSTPDVRTIKRVLKEFQTLDPEIVAREFHPYVWKMRHDFEEIKACLESERTIHEERKEFLPLLQRWREQVHFSSPDELLRELVSAEIYKDRLHHTTNAEPAAKIYDAAKRHHARPIPGPVRTLMGVEQEGLFQRLGQCLPDDPVWEAEDTFTLACGAYIEAFVSWFGEVRYEFEFCLALAIEDQLGGAAREAANGLDLLERIKKQDVNWPIMLRLGSIVVSCDLLTLGIAELPPSLLWFFQVDKLMTLRSLVVVVSTTLPKDLRLAEGNDFGAVARLLWEHEAKLRQDTMGLLQKLERLQATHDDLLRKLTVLEWRLYDVAESQPS